MARLRTYWCVKNSSKKLKLPDRSPKYLQRLLLKKATKRRHTQLTGDTLFSDTLGADSRRAHNTRYTNVVFCGSKSIAKVSWTGNFRAISQQVPQLKSHNIVVSSEWIGLRNSLPNLLQTLAGHKEYCCILHVRSILRAQDASRQTVCIRNENSTQRLSMEAAPRSLVQSSTLSRASYGAEGSKVSWARSMPTRKC